MVATVESVVLVGGMVSAFTPARRGPLNTGAPEQPLPPSWCSRAPGR